MYVDRSGVHRDYSKRGFKTKKAAMIHETEKRQEIVDYGEIVGNAELTFNEVFREYMNIESVNYSRATIKNYEYSFQNYVLHDIGQRKIMTLIYRDLQSYFNELNASYETKRNLRKVFAITFKYAIKNGYIKSNPLQYVTIKRTEADDLHQTETITKEQLDTIIDRTLTIDKRTPDFDYTLFNNYSFAVALYIGWYTGFRVSETFGLMKKDFDFENNTVFLRRRLDYVNVKKAELYTTEKMKTRKSKAIVPLPLELKEILQKWFEKNPYEKVIVDINGNFIHPSTFNARMRCVSLDTGIHFHYHMLRHSYATNLIRNGVNTKVTMELVRHSDIRTTLNTYTHVNEDDLKSAVDKVFNKVNS